MVSSVGKRRIVVFERQRDDNGDRRALQEGVRMGALESFVPKVIATHLHLNALRILQEDAASRMISAASPTAAALKLASLEGELRNREADAASPKPSKASKASVSSSRASVASKASAASSAWSSDGSGSDDASGRDSGDASVSLDARSGVSPQFAHTERYVKDC